MLVQEDVPFYLAHVTLCDMRCCDVRCVCEVTQSGLCVGYIHMCTCVSCVYVTRGRAAQGLDMRPRGLLLQDLPSTALSSLGQTPGDIPPGVRLYPIRPVSRGSGSLTRVRTICSDA